jgi:hypothetical protein
MSALKGLGRLREGSMGISVVVSMRLGEAEIRLAYQDDDTSWIGHLAAHIGNAVNVMACFWPGLKNPARIETPGPRI